MRPKRSPLALSVLLLVLALAACAAGTTPRPTPTPPPGSIRAELSTQPTATGSPAEAGLGVLDLPAWETWCGPLNPFEVTTLDGGWRSYYCTVDQFSMSFATNPARGDEALVQTFGSLEVITGRISDQGVAAWRKWNETFRRHQPVAVTWINDQLTPYVTTFPGTTSIEKLFTNNGTINAGVATSDLGDLGGQLITFWLEVPHT